MSPRYFRVVVIGVSTSITEKPASGKPAPAEEGASDEELARRIALHLLPGIGPVMARQLVSYCGGIEAIFKKRKGQLERIPGIGPERADAILKANVLQRAEEEVRYIRKHSIRSYCYLDADYPYRLKQCDTAPVLLFGRGNLRLNAARMLAVVGTRKVTDYGRELIAGWMEGLKARGVTIVSGLAYGVDIVAHQEALRHGLPTIGVTAHGLDRLYPDVHLGVARRMEAQGGVLTEYATRTRPDRDNFPARNRIVAGLCDATLVVESASRGGALITAQFANEYNREVFAIPGRITDTYSRGCHWLVRENLARLVEAPEQLVDLMGWDEAEGDAALKNTTRQLPLFTELSDEEQPIIGLLRHGAEDLDSLAFRLRMPVSRLSVMLLQLEFRGIVRMRPGNRVELRA